LTRKAVPRAQASRVAKRMVLLRWYLSAECTFLEVGPGDCSLAYKVSKFVKRVYAVDVSREITRNDECPGNFCLIISDGCSIPVPESSVDVAYSDQLMEHLHPDDALEQLGNIYRVLVPGGSYLCITPNRLSGPHDISRHFDAVATGLHLREYTTGELADLFSKVGFSRIKAVIGGKGRYLFWPVCPVRWLEGVLGRLPHALCRRLSLWLPIRLLVGGGGIIMLGVK